MRFPHTLRFTREDGTTFESKGYAEVVDDSRFGTDGVMPTPRIEAILPPGGYGTRTVVEGDRLECTDVPGIKGVVTQVRPVTSARTRRIHHVEVSAGV